MNPFQNIGSKFSGLLNGLTPGAPGAGPQVGQGGMPMPGAPRSGVMGLVDRLRGPQQPPMGAPMGAAPQPAAGMAPTGMASPTGDPLGNAQPDLETVNVSGQRVPPQPDNSQRMQQYAALQQMTSKPMPSQQLMQARALRGRAM